MSGADYVWIVQYRSPPKPQPPIGAFDTKYQLIYWLRNYPGVVEELVVWRMRTGMWHGKSPVRLDPVELIKAST